MKRFAAILFVVLPLLSCDNGNSIPTLTHDTENITTFANSSLSTVHISVRDYGDFDLAPQQEKTIDRPRDTPFSAYTDNGYIVHKINKWTVTFYNPSGKITVSNISDTGIIADIVITSKIYANNIGCEVNDSRLNIGPGQNKEYTLLTNESYWVIIKTTDGKTYNSTKLLFLQDKTIVYDGNKIY
jgi:hypothetical protein